MEQKKSLSDLAVKLRILRDSEKKEYIERLDEDADDYQAQVAAKKIVSPFFLQDLAYSMYYSLEGTPYTQPEFSSQATKKDIQAREKFNALFSGIVAYAKASDEQRKAFKKSVLKRPFICKKLFHLVKIHQNGIA